MRKSVIFCDMCGKQIGDGSSVVVSVESLSSVKELCEKCSESIAPGNLLGRLGIDPEDFRGGAMEAFGVLVNTVERWARATGKDVAESRKGCVGHVEAFIARSLDIVQESARDGGAKEDLLEFLKGKLVSMASACGVSHVEGRIGDTAHALEIRSKHREVVLKAVVDMFGIPEGVGVIGFLRDWLDVRVKAEDDLVKAASRVGYCPGQGIVPFIEEWVEKQIDDGLKAHTLLKRLSRLVGVEYTGDISVDLGAVERYVLADRNRRPCSGEYPTCYKNYEEMVKILERIRVMLGLEKSGDSIKIMREIEKVAGCITESREVSSTTFVGVVSSLKRIVEKAGVERTGDIERDLLEVEKVLDGMGELRGASIVLGTLLRPQQSS